MDDNTIHLVYLDVQPNLSAVSRVDDGDRELYLMQKAVRHARRILVDKGNLFLNTAPDNSDRFRAMLNQALGTENFRGEYALTNILHSQVWSGRPYSAYQSILHYSKSSEFTYNRVFRPATSEELSQRGYSKSESGILFRWESLTSSTNNSARRFEFKGVIPSEGSGWKYDMAQLEELDRNGLISQSNPQAIPRLKRVIDASYQLDVTHQWTEISPQPGIDERRTYQGQKSGALMDRLIHIGSNPDDIVLDPFVGTGTTLIAAHNNRRKWLGCDDNPEAIDIAIKRLYEKCGLVANRDFMCNS